MWLSEMILFGFAKAFYRTETAHSNEMKQAMRDRDQYDSYRGSQLASILTSARQYDVEIQNKILLDVGCSNGAITAEYLKHGARQVIGVDIDRRSIRQARAKYNSPGASFRVSTPTSLPVADHLVDTVICYDVFEHVANPAATLAECYRVLRPGGRMLIGTWGWYHPYAPHLWSVMPVPWAHIVFSEKTILRTCRRVYHSRWYVPNIYDFDAAGRRLRHRFENEEIMRDYLNKYLLKDFERVFEESPFNYRIHPQHFSAKYARWTKAFLNFPWIREFITAYIWVVLEKEESATSARGSTRPAASRLELSK